MRDVDGFLKRVGEEIKAREVTHPDPRAEFQRIGRLWGEVLGVGPIAADTVGLMLILLKVARESLRHNEDNLFDIAGYAAVLGAIWEG